MLWVNLIMDTFAALALATEAPSKALLESSHERGIFCIHWQFGFVCKAHNSSEKIQSSQETERHSQIILIQDHRG